MSHDELVFVNPMAYKRNDRVPMYENPVGPGDYNIPKYSGADTVSDSNHRNPPKYSIQLKTKLPFFPQYELDFKGRDSPGINVYNPNTSFSKPRMPENAKSSEKRFVY